MSDKRFQTVVGHKGPMFAHQEAYCPSCGKTAESLGGYTTLASQYRCLSCDRVSVWRELPRRMVTISLPRSTPVGKGNTGLRGTGGGLRDFGVPFGTLLPLMEGQV